MSTSTTPLALPAGPAPAPRRQVLVGTVLACAGGVTLIAGLLGLMLKMRDRAMDAGTPWVPKDISINMVAPNTMLLAFIPACIFAQWAVYAAKRNDRSHAGVALGLTAVLGIAIVNAQAFVYSQTNLPAKGTAYNSLFYAVTGVFTVLAIIGIVFSIVAAFRYLGRRAPHREIVAAHALYWYFLAAAFAAVWFVVYVTK